MKFKISSEQIAELCKVFRHVPMRPTCVDAYKIICISANEQQISVEFHTDYFHFVYRLEGICEEPGRVFISASAINTLSKFAKGKMGLIIYTLEHDLVFERTAEDSIQFHLYQYLGEPWLAKEAVTLMVMDKWTIQFIAKYTKSSFCKEENESGTWRDYSGGPYLNGSVLTDQYVCMKDNFHLVSYDHHAPLSCLQPFAYEVSPWTSRLFYAMSGVGSTMKTMVAKDNHNQLMLGYDCGTCAVYLPTKEVSRWWRAELVDRCRPERGVMFDQKNLKTVISNFVLDKKLFALYVTGKDGKAEFRYEGKHYSQKAVLPIATKSGQTLPEFSFICNIHYFSEIIQMMNEHLIQLVIGENLISFYSVGSDISGKLGLLRQKDPEI